MCIYIYIYIHYSHITYRDILVSKGCKKKKY